MIRRSARVCATQPTHHSDQLGPSIYAIDFTTFPSTRYQGSKRKITPWLHDIFAGIEFNSVVDIFGGSGTVSYLLKRMGKQVTYNDLLHCNYLTALALIENDAAHLEESFDVLKPTRRDARDYSFVRAAFRNFYFTDYENAWIDRAVFSLDAINNRTVTNRYKRALGYHALFQTCLVKRPFNLFHRKNLYLRTADVKRTFGNKTTWDTPINRMFLRFVSEANRAVFRGKLPCKAYNYDAQEFPHSDCDLIYIDPPYLAKAQTLESADYFRNYHFIEGLSRYRIWPTAIDYESHLLALKQDKPNPFVKPSTNRKALRSLFERFENSKLVISYKRFGIPSLTWFTDELRRIGKKVSYRTRHYKYALNSQNGDAARNREILIVAQ